MLEKQNHVFIAGSALLLMLCSCASVGGETLSSQFARENIETLNIPDIPRDLILRADQYRNIRSTRFVSWMPDSEGIVISAKFGSQRQLFHVASPLGMRRQIFFSEDVGESAIMAPEGGPNGFLFIQSGDGDEINRLHFFDLDKLDSTALGPEGGRHEYAGWSRDGEMAFWSHSATENANRSIYVSSSNAMDEPRKVLEREGLWIPVEFSNDNRQLLIFRFLSRAESELYAFDLESEELRAVNPRNKRIAYEFLQVRFSGDGRSVYYLSDEGGEFQKLSKIDLASGDTTTLTSASNQDIEYFDISPDGQTLALVTNTGGLSRISVHRTVDMQVIATPRIPPARIFQPTFSPDNQKIAIFASGSTVPDGVFVHDLRENSTELWAESEIGALDNDQFSEPELFSYPTFDEVDGARRVIPGLIYKPQGDGPFPVLINFHGGPEGQFRGHYDEMIQFLANELNIAVIGPNIRGSDGYGKTFVALDNGFGREASLRDIGALLDWIEAQDNLDADRVATYGISYGGYASQMALALYNDRLRGGIALVGPTDLVTFLENTSPYRRDLRRVEYGDERDLEMRAFLRTISPLFNAENITKPLFIIQGRNDPRVPYTQAEKMVRAVADNGAPVWYLLAHDEGHIFTKPDNRAFANQATFLFLDRIMELRRFENE